MHPGWLPELVAAGSVHRALGPVVPCSGSLLTHPPEPPPPPDAETRRHRLVRLSLLVSAAIPPGATAPDADRGVLNKLARLMDRAVRDAAAPHGWSYPDTVDARIDEYEGLLFDAGFLVGLPMDHAHLHTEAFAEILAEHAGRFNVAWGTRALAFLLLLGHSLFQTDAEAREVVLAERIMAPLFRDENLFRADIDPALFLEWTGTVQRLLDTTSVNRPRYHALLGAYRRRCTERCGPPKLVRVANPKPVAPGKAPKAPKTKPKGRTTHTGKAKQRKRNLVERAVDAVVDGILSGLRDGT